MGVPTAEEVRSYLNALGLVAIARERLLPVTAQATVPAHDMHKYGEVDVGKYATTILMRTFADEAFKHLRMTHFPDEDGKSTVFRVTTTLLMPKEG